MSNNDTDTVVPPGDSESYAGPSRACDKKKKCRTALNAMEKERYVDTEWSYLMTHGL